MTTLRSSASIAILLAVVTGACHRSEPRLATASQEPLRSRVVPVASSAERQLIDVYGVVQPARQSFVSARVMGPVVKVMVDASDRVRKGQPLLEIQPQAADGQVAQARGALAQAQAGLALAEKGLHRFEGLHASNAASDVELDLARMQYDQAKGAVQQAEGAVQAAATVAADAQVSAPFDARVVSRMVEVGDLATPGRPLVQLESLSGHEIWITVREADIARCALGQQLGIRFDARGALGEVKGNVSEIMPSADPATHTFVVKVALGDLEIPTGSSGRALLPGDTAQALLVPASAVHRRGGLELVVIRGDDGRARTRAVTTGRLLEGQRVEVLTGLTGGEQVVVDAPGPVADGTPVEVTS